MKIDYSKKVKLANIPTEIQLLKNLTTKETDPNIYIKRDDEIGLAFGGNKVRKLEYIMYDVLEKKADVVITSGGVQTNHGRLTVAAANKFGLKSVLVLTGEEPEKYTGNLLLNHLMGAELHFAFDNNYDSSKMNQNEANRLAGEKKVEELVKKYEQEGKRVYVVPRGGRCNPGTLGYAYAVKEILKQEKELNVTFDYIFTSVGSSSTLGGLLVGKHLYGLNAKIVGISVSRKSNEIKERVKEQIKSFSEHYQVNVDINDDEFNIYDEYVGEGYTIPTKLGEEAIKIFAERESVFIDQNYTGKGASGLLDLVRKGFFKPDDNVLFIHTGGAPALFR